MHPGSSPNTETHVCTCAQPNLLRRELRFVWVSLCVCLFVCLRDSKSDRCSSFSISAAVPQRVAVCSHRNPSLRVHSLSLKSVPLRGSAGLCIITAGGLLEAHLPPSSLRRFGSSADVSAAHLNAWKWLIGLYMNIGVCVCVYRTLKGCWKVKILF